MTTVLCCAGSDGFQSEGLSTWFFYESHGYCWVVDIHQTYRRRGFFNRPKTVLSWAPGKNVEKLAETFIHSSKPYWGYGGITKRELKEVAVEVGTYYPRIYKLGLDQFNCDGPTFEKTESDNSRAARNLHERLEEIFSVVEPTAANMEVHGLRIRELLILACMEVESSWSGILRANGYTNNRLDTRDYVKLLTPLKLNEYKSNSLNYPELPLFIPFQDWDLGSPTKSLPWYNAYNKTKHNREEFFELATLGNAIDAIVAVDIMNYVQFGLSLSSGLDILSPSMNDYYLADIAVSPSILGDSTYRPRPVNLRPVNFPFT